MAAERPYFRLSILELERLARKSLANDEVLEGIIAELAHRSVGGAAGRLLWQLTNWRKARARGEKVTGLEFPPEDSESAKDSNSTSLVSHASLSSSSSTSSRTDLSREPTDRQSDAEPPTSHASASAKTSGGEGAKSASRKTDLERSRQSLLDIRANNPLINCPLLLHSNDWKGRGSDRYRVLGTPDLVIARLIEKEDKARIYALDPDELNAWRQSGRRAATGSTAAEGAGLRQPPEAILKHLQDGHLALETDIETAQAALARLRKAQDLREREIGDSAMFLTFGCLHWPIRDSTGNSKSVVSPLLVMHVNVTSATSGQGGRPVFSVFHDGDGIQDNQSLLVKFHQEHGIRLPEWRSGSFSDLKAYLTRLDQLIADVQGAKAHGTMSLGQFHFANYRMWMDLDQKEWGNDTPPGQHPLVSHLLSNSQIPNFCHVDLRDAEHRAGQHQATKDLPIITECDSSQYHTVMRIVNGDSLITVGPPGTGKSQTIVNAIACLIAAGKSVLFVAQKTAALSVVYKRLAQASLSEQVLPIFSKDATSRKILDRLGLAARQRRGRERNPVQPTAPGHRLRQLNAYAEVLHSGHDAGDQISKVVRRGIVAAEKISKRWSGFLDNRPDMGLGSLPLTPAWWEDRRSALRAWAVALGEASRVWAGWIPSVSGSEHTNKIRDAIRRCCETTFVLRSLGVSAQAPTDLTLIDLESVANQVEQLEHLVDLKTVYQVILDELRSTAAGFSREVDDLQRSVATWHQLRERSSRILGVVEAVDREHLTQIEKAATDLSCLASHHETIATVRHRLQARRAIAEAIARLQEVGQRESAGIEAISGATTWLWSTVDLVSAQKPTAHGESTPRLLPALCRHLAENPDQLLVASELHAATSRLKETENAFQGARIPLDRLPGDHLTKIVRGIEHLRDGLPSSTLVDQLAAIGDQYRLVVQAVQEVISSGSEWMEHPASATSRQMNALARLTNSKSLSIPAEALPPVIAAWSKGLDLDRIDQLTGTLQQLVAARDVGEHLLVQLSDPATTVAALSTADQALVACLQFIDFTDDLTIATVAGIRDLITIFQTEWDSTITQVGVWADQVGIGRPATVPALERLSKVQLLLARRIVLVEGASAQRLADPLQKERLAKARQRCEDLARDRAAMSIDFCLDDLANISDLQKPRDEWASYRRSLLRFIPFTKSLLKERIAKLNHGTIPTDEQWTIRIQRLGKYLRDKNDLLSDDGIRAIVGNAWRGLDTNWATVDEMLAWASSLRQEAGPLIDLDRLVAAPPATKSIDLLVQQWKSAGSTTGLQPSALAYADDLILGSVRGRIDRLALALQGGVTAIADVGYPLGGTIAGWRAGVQGLRDRDRLTSLLHANQVEVPGLDLSEIAMEPWRTTVEWLRLWEECGLNRPGIFATAERLQSASLNFQRFVDAIRTFQRALAGLPLGHSGKPAGGIVASARAIDGLVELLSAAAEALHQIPAIMGTLPQRPDLTLGQIISQTDAYTELLKLREKLAPWSRILGREITGDDAGPIADTIGWVKQVRSDGATRGLIIWMSTAETAARMAWWRSLTGEAAKVRALVVPAQADGTLPTQATLHALSIDRWLGDNATIQQSCAVALDIIHRRLKNPSATLQNIADAISEIREEHSIASRLEIWRAKLGQPATKLDPELIAAHERFAQAALTLPPWIAKWVLADYTQGKLQALLSLKSDLAKARRARTAAEDLLEEYGRRIAGGPLGMLSWNGTLADLGDAAQVLHEGLGGFGAYVEACAAERSLTAYQLRQLVTTVNRVLTAHAVDQRRQALDTRPWPGELATSPQVSDAEIKQHRVIWKAIEEGSLAGVITDLFEWAVEVHLAEHVISEHPELEAFDAPEHERCRSKFAEADERAIQTNAAYIKQIVLNRTIDPGVGSGRTSDWTGGKLLDKQMALDRKSMRPRQIIQQAGEAMKGYCPCWLMTPAAVAQFLPPGKISFDVVIFDEASQIPPAEAWGAMARAKQVVLVGDPKQMPPSNWFKGEHGDDEDDDDEVASHEPAQESILDQAQEVLPSSMLRWHYRSLHHSLIAPANLFSYNGDLLIFPSSVAKSDELGIGWHPVTEGTFLARANIPEALAIVEWLEPRLLSQATISLADRDQAGTSYGVLTMNLRQQQIIEDLLAKRAQKLPDLERYLAEEEDRMRDGRPGFCVKNLENYQGDERDIMVLSFTYGPDKPRGQAGEWSGRKSFSSVNGNAGKRRFNVMITRARKRMEVFSSLYASDVPQVTDATAGSGVADMKRFLEFAQTGILPDYGHATGRDYDSDFEESVHRFLQEHQYDLEPQVGVAEYRIDLALRHPKDRERFILAIECDGRLYHSSRSARDRDRLRERVLRDRGWTFYRIWSTDWFHDPVAARERLLSAVKNAVAAHV